MWPRTHVSCPVRPGERRAYDHWVIEGLTNNDAAAKQAADAVLAKLAADYSLASPTDSTLPVYTIAATRDPGAGSTRAHARVEYRQNANPAGATNFTRFTSVLRSEERRWYSGVLDYISSPPAGPADFPSGGYELSNGSLWLATWRDYPQASLPPGIIVPWPILRIRIPFTLTTNPLTVNQWAICGRINSDAFALGNYTFPPGQLRFVGTTVREVDTGTSTLYTGDYEFDAAYLGHYRQTVEWAITAPDNGQWRPRLYLDGLATTFAGRLS
jgi:hypothetical protein